MTPRVGDEFQIYDGDVGYWVLCQVESIGPAPKPLPYDQLITLKPVAPIVHESGRRQIYALPWPEGRHLVKKKHHKLKGRRS